jgi:putrescine transport system permease protein
MTAEVTRQQEEAAASSATARGAAWLPRFVTRFTGRGIVILPPMVWLVLFFLVPLAVVISIAFSVAKTALPPFEPLITFGEDNSIQLTLRMANILYLFQDNLYVDAFVNSVWVAAVSTMIALVIAYPMAYFIARASERTRNILLMLVILPFWSSFLLRVYAWISILKQNGLINNFLHMFGLGPFSMLYTNSAIYVGIVYTYLPFMILPLYTTLVKLDQALLEASADLGARPYRTFLSVTLPLSLPGVVAGSMLVFIPAIGEYVIPQLLGGPNSLMIGRVLWDTFFADRDWPLASTVALFMLLVVVAPLLLLQRAQDAVVEQE